MAGGGTTAAHEQALAQASTTGTASTALDTPKKVSVGDLIEAQRDQIARALPRAVPVERFMRVLLTEIRKNPALLEATRESFFGAVMTAAQLGLEFGPLGQAYLTGPFWSGKAQAQEVNLIIGYKGYQALARRSGDISTIDAHEVYAADFFEYEYGSNSHLTHKPSLGEHGEITHFYSFVKMADGGESFEVLSKAQVDERRERSKAKDFGPWVSDYIPMGRKSAFRAHQAWLPQSAEMAMALALDDTVINLRGEELIPDRSTAEAIPIASAEPAQETAQYADDDPERPFEGAENKEDTEA